MKTYDLIVIGGGPGGYVAAIKAAQLNAKVALIEKEKVGGICLNHGCIPTKTLLKSTKVYKTLLSAKDYGVLVDGDITFDWTAMVKRKDTVVRRLTAGVGSLLKKNGVDVYDGEGKPVNATKVEVNGETLEAKYLMIATGARPIIPPIPGLKEAMEKEIVITSRELLQIKKAPKSLVVIGGGVIGIEFATMFKQLGSKVIVIEKMPGILPMIDDDVRDAYVKILKKDGVEVLTEAEVVSFEDNKVVYKHNGKDELIEAEKVLLSIGMRPNVEGFESLGIQIERQGIVTNEYLQTTVPNIYAIGDVNGKYMLAHVASAEGIIAAEHMFSERKPKMRYDRVPSAIYGSPEIASIGITEQEAKEKKINYKASTFPLAGNGRALSENEKDGFVKLIVEEGSKEVLGAHILAYNASELIAEIGVTMELEGTAYELGSTIHAHPTLSEIIMEAAHGAIDKPIHF